MNNLLDNWLEENTENNTARLFKEENGIVSTIYRGGRRELERNPQFTELMIRTVEGGLQTNSWEGFVYIMHWKQNDKTIPLYIGKAERRGITQEVSFNINNIRKNDHAFGRWGYGLAYHIGDLSHWLFPVAAYKNPSPNYGRWAKLLFTEFDPPQLRETVYISLFGWHKGMIGPSGLECSVPSLEKELIALSSALYPLLLLNVDGR